MLNRPQFKPHLHVEPVADEGIFVLSELGHHVLTGPLTELVVPLIDGQRTADAIADELGGKARMEDVYYTLALLQREGHLIEASDPVRPERAAFWSSLGADPVTAEGRLRTRSVTVRTIGEVDARTAHDALAADGIAVTENGDVTVVVVDDYARPQLAAINAEHLAAGRPWMLAKPGGVVAWIGPLFLPGDTGCWSCLAQRLRGNREVESFIERKGASGPFPVALGKTAGTSAHALGLVATHLAIVLGRGDDAALAGRIVTVNVATFQTDAHVLTRRPQCAACGDPEIVHGLRPVRLAAGTGFVRDNGVRGVAPEQTYERYGHHVSPITGVVSSLLPAVMPGPLHVYVAGHNFALKNDSLYFLQDGLRTKSSGKGRTDAQARASALCEAIERYSGVYRGDEPATRATYRELGELAIHPNACMNFSDRQFAEREAWLARGSRFQVVPRPFSEDARVDWTPVYSLTNDRFRFVPTAYCYYGYPVPDEEFYYWADSNGNAAGNSLEEAILQGFFELVERDSVALWWYNRLPQPAVDVASFNEPYYEQLREYYREIGREFWVLDLTSDTEIPAFAALSRRTDSQVEDIIIGFGAHADARTALMRAVTEMNQFMPGVLQRNPDGTTDYQYHDRDALAWWHTATTANQPYLLPAAAAPRCAQDFASTSSGDVGEDVRTCVRIAQRLGLETFVLDQTRPDIGLPVVKVIVPGIRHFWARFAPGRLYDVPVRQGRLPAPLPESALNPVAMFV